MTGLSTSTFPSTTPAMSAEAFAGQLAKAFPPGTSVTKWPAEGHAIRAGEVAGISVVDNAVHIAVTNVKNEHGTGHHGQKATWTPEPDQVWVLGGSVRTTTNDTSVTYSAPNTQTSVSFSKPTQR